MNFKKNLGALDRILRIGFSCFMIYFGFIDNTILTDPVTKIILGVFGSIVLVSALVGNCPLYYLTGFNTCKQPDNNETT